MRGFKCSLTTSNHIKAAGAAVTLSNPNLLLDLFFFLSFFSRHHFFSLHKPGECVIFTLAMNRFHFAQLQFVQPGEEWVLLQCWHLFTRAKKTQRKTDYRCEPEVQTQSASMERCIESYEYCITQWSWLPSPYWMYWIQTCFVSLQWSTLSI